MATQFSIHPDLDLAYFRFTGVITVKDGAQVFRDYISHPAFDPAHVMLTDTQHLTDVEATYRSMIFAVQHLIPSFGRFRQLSRSIIHAPDDVSFGTARMMQQVVEPFSKIEFTICRDAAEALHLAGLDFGEFAQLDRVLGLQHAA